MPGIWMVADDIGFVDLAAQPRARGGEARALEVLHTATAFHFCSRRTKTELVSELVCVVFRSDIPPSFPLFRLMAEREEG
jgi:hypothetical protein